jgi:hypothetical protein
LALTGFTALDIQNAFEADVTRAESFSIIIRVDDNVLELLDVSKVGGTLRLRLEPGTSLRGDVTLEATITMPVLESLRLSGASKANVSGFRLSDRLDVGLSGASRVDGDVEAGEIDIEASGASRVTLAGSGTDLTLEGSGASDLNLANFVVDSADIELSGASQATVNVQERIDSADVSGASRLRYRGNPSLGDVYTSGGGTVDKVD